jgi:ankyrin repeat protein
MAATGQSRDAFQAIRNNDLAYLRAQIRTKEAANARDRRGATLLMHAAAFGSPEAMKLLLDRGADVNARNAFDATALVWGAADERKVHMLAEKGANVNARTKQGRTPLMAAAACDGCSGIVRYLLSKGADPKVKDNSGGTALKSAAAAGDAATVRLLLEAGADPNATDSSGSTPLLWAVTNCSLPSVQALIAKGAQVNLAMTDAGTVKFGKIQLVGLTPLMVAAPYCGAEMTETLLDAGANVNARDIRGMTPLMLALASEAQNLDRVNLLLNSRADVAAKSNVGETPLDWALKYGHPAIIETLQAKGAPRGDAPAPAPPATGPVLPIREAVQSSAALLARTSGEFFRQSGCVGCHHQPMAIMALTAARSHGAHVDEQAIRGFVQMIESEWTGEQEQLLERIDPGGLADGEGYMTWALNAAQYAPNSLTDVIAVHVASLQHPAGNWHVGDASRSPIQESEIARTARAMRLLQVYGPPARKAEFAQRIASAATWLRSAKPVTTDDAAMQLIGLHWEGAAESELRSLGSALIAAQRKDGGWAQNSHLESDAYATGEALWALREAGLLTPTHVAYQRGVRFLLDTQIGGAWYVKSRAPKFQPYFESGFPFGHDQWISSAGTAWAVMALAPAMEKDAAAGR